MDIDEAIDDDESDKKIKGEFDEDEVDLLVGKPAELLI